MGALFFVLSVHVGCPLCLYCMLCDVRWWQLSSPIGINKVFSILFSLILNLILNLFSSVILNGWGVSPCF